MTIRLTDSPYLETLPPIDASHSLLLTPASYVSWAACLAANPTILDFLLQAGDYTAWGLCTLDGALYADGVAGRRRTIRYYGADSATHPCRRSNEARVDAIKFQNGADFWHIHGLTQRAPTADSTLTISSDNVLDFMLVEDSPRTYGFRNFGGSNRNTFQRNVIRNSTQVGQDTLGVQTFPSNGQAITGVKILDNEIYNYGDGVGCSQNVANEFVAVDVLCEGNDMYITEDKYLPDGLSDAENAIDLKTGSDTVQTVIRRNRCWGFRSNGTSATGDAWVAHRAARNVLFEENIVGDCVRAFHESAWITFPTGPADPQTPRNIIIRNNSFYEIHEYSDEDSAGPGACVRPISNTLVEGNTFARSDYVLYIHQAMIAGGPSFRDNTQIATPNVAHPDTFANPYDDTLNRIAWTPARYESYERKRWTGPETAIAANPGATERHQITVRL